MSIYIQLILLAGIGYKIIDLLTPEDVKNKRKIRKKLRIFFDKRNIKNISEDKPNIEYIELIKSGFESTIHISGICSFDEFKKQQDYLKQLFMAESIEMSNLRGRVILEVIEKPIRNMKFKKVELPSTTVLLGYRDTGEPITVDMLKTPHIGVVGLSNNGKSKMIEGALKNLSNADILLVNVFKKDFRSIKARRINGEENIINLLKDILDNPNVRERPLYIAIDELNVLSNNKDINRAIGDLLKVARHYNIYLICMAQDMLKETVKFKNLFNVRVTFRCIEESSYRAFLGVTVPEGNIMPKEFYCLSDTFFKGNTYIV